MNLNPSKKILQIRDSKAWMSKPVAQCFLDLAKNNKVPEWALAMLEDDVKRIRMAAL